MERLPSVPKLPTAQNGRPYPVENTPLVPADWSSLNSPTTVALGSSTKVAARAETPITVAWINPIDGSVQDSVTVTPNGQTTVTALPGGFATSRTSDFSYTATEFSEPLYSSDAGAGLHQSRVEITEVKPAETVMPDPLPPVIAAEHGANAEQPQKSEAVTQFEAILEMFAAQAIQAEQAQLVRIEEAIAQVEAAETEQAAEVTAEVGSPLVELVEHLAKQLLRRLMKVKEVVEVDQEVSLNVEPELTNEETRADRIAKQPLAVQEFLTALPAAVADEVLAKFESGHIDIDKATQYIADKMAAHVISIANAEYERILKLGREQYKPEEVLAEI